MEQQPMPNSSRVSGRVAMAPGRGLLVAAVLSALVGLDAPPVAGQAGTTTGVIRGTVRDQLGDRMPGAVIVIQHRETDLLTTVETSSVGTFVHAAAPQHVRPDGGRGDGGLRDRAHRGGQPPCGGGTGAGRRPARRGQETVTVVLERGADLLPGLSEDAGREPRGRGAIALEVAASEQ